MDYLDNIVRKLSGFNKIDEVIEDTLPDHKTRRLESLRKILDTCSDLVLAVHCHPGIALEFNI